LYLYRCSFRPTHSGVGAQPASYGASLSFASFLPPVELASLHAHTACPAAWSGSPNLNPREKNMRKPNDITLTFGVKGTILLLLWLWLLLLLRRLVLSFDDLSFRNGRADDKRAALVKWVGEALVTIGITCERTPFVQSTPAFQGTA